MNNQTESAGADDPTASRPSRSGWHPRSLLRIMRPFFVILIFLAVLVPAVAHAKRGPKPKVDPVDYQGVHYAPHGDGRTQYVQALDIKTGKTLWNVVVFSTIIIPLLEEDVQWVFIKRMFIDDAKLIVVAEDDRAYSLDLKTGAVKKLKQEPLHKTRANKSLQAMRDGRSGSVSRFTSFGPAGSLGRFTLSIS